MSDRFILSLLNDVRQQLLDVVTKVAPYRWTVIPAGFRNHLHWQLGHALTVTDELILGLASGERSLSSEYYRCFAVGTSPQDWSGDVPDPRILLLQLGEQVPALIDKYDDKLDEPVAQSDNFLQASVTRELFYVLLAHESTHLGMVTAMTTMLRSGE